LKLQLQLLLVIFETQCSLKSVVTVSVHILQYDLNDWCKPLQTKT